VAADTGGAIKGMKIDLCMEDYAQAWGFGRRYVKVYVLED
jgi:3D (Asp-Asp-Asp) domain-containing protein